MTKKDYMKFADFFRGQLEIANNATSLVADEQKEKADLLVEFMQASVVEFLQASVKDFAILLKEDNERFDRQRFLNACGILQ